MLDMFQARFGDRCRADSMRPNAVLGFGRYQSHARTGYGAFRRTVSPFERCMVLCQGKVRCLILMGEGELVALYHCYINMVNVGFVEKYRIRPDCPIYSIMLTASSMSPFGLPTAEFFRLWLIRESDLILCYPSHFRSRHYSPIGCPTCAVSYRTKPRLSAKSRCYAAPIRPFAGEEECDVEMVD
jgi:hypothetical protein